ncbi:hypothetical protein ABH959_000724 [Bacillus sp. RC51]
MPRFKSKKNTVQSYTTKQTNGNIGIVGNTIKLPKLGLVRFAKSREVEGRILHATIRRNPSGKYFVSIHINFFKHIKTVTEIATPTVTSEAKWAPTTIRLIGTSILLVGSYKLLDICKSVNAKIHSKIAKLEINITFLFPIISPTFHYA